MNKKFIKSARQKLKNSNAKIIAITGSNGKTSTKNILKEILATTYKVQASPESYNTPLGIAKFINNDLKRETEFVILEYGARHKNDIKELCKLYGADYGIITSISAQHLETFKSVENVFIAKSYLANFLKNKPCIYNLDNIFCLRAYEQKIGEKYGVTLQNSNIEISNFKTTFDINLETKKFLVTTNLLGTHNVKNIMLASSLANLLGVNSKNIKEIVGKLTPTPHRLQFIKTHINILDDSYNCSLDSAKQAIKVLSYFPNKKMIVTPGIIEGGKFEQTLNISLGEICSVSDYVVIVGEHNKKSILEGLKNKNYETKKILFAKSLNDAKQYFKILNSNDSLLLLNDLPDDYN